MEEGQLSLFLINTLLKKTQHFFNTIWCFLPESANPGLHGLGRKLQNFPYKFDIHSTKSNSTDTGITHSSECLTVVTLEWLTAVTQEYLTSVTLG